MQRAQEVKPCRCQSESEEEDTWVDCILRLYPELHSRTYFFPPLHINRVPYGRQEVAGEVVLVRRNITDSDGTTSPLVCQTLSKETDDERLRSQRKKRKSDKQNDPTKDPPALSMWTHTDRDVSKPVTESDVRGDMALDCILTCLRKMADDCEPKQAMMIISQLPFGQFFRKNSAAIIPSLSSNCQRTPQKFRQGDLDILIIHNKYGLITGEIKSVGASLSQRQDENFEKSVRKKIKDSIKQLEKANVVLKMLISGLPVVPITHTLMLPNMTSHELQRIIDDDTELAKELQQLMNSSSTSGAVKRILCTEHVVEPVIHNMRNWFDQFSMIRYPDISRFTFERLVARFCGPEITVHIHSVTTESTQLRTEGEGVSEAGNILTQLILIPQQINILRQSEPRVFLGGPPGTGKTVVLTLQGLSWLRRGFNVHLVSTWKKSRASAITMEDQLKRRHSLASPQSSAQVHLHIYDFERTEDIGIAVSDLVKAANSENRIRVIAETAGPNGSSFKKFCKELIKYIPEVQIWAAAAYKNIRPKCLQEYTMQESLRIPTPVKLEVVKAQEMQNGSVCTYASDTSVNETHGPHKKIIHHTKGRCGHSEDNLPENCKQCGHGVAVILKELNVGAPGASLQFRDVLVLCNSPSDDQKDVDGVVLSKANGLVEGLRAKDIPLCVQTPAQQQSLTQGNINSETGQNIRDLVLGKIDKVMVTHSDCVWGLKRKVVVIANYGQGHDSLIDPARCSSQLVEIHSSQ